MTDGAEVREDAAADPLWDDWETPPRVPPMPVLHLEGFDGPMDLLLELAERQRIDLGRMSVQALAEQFVVTLTRLARRVPLERRADWVVLATRLVLLRSRLIFPASPQEAASAEQEAARTLRRLDELATMRRVASWLEARPQLRQELFTRGQVEQPRPEGGGYVALMEACLKVLRHRTRTTEPQAPYRPSLPVFWTITDALARIEAHLREHPEGAELEGFLPEMVADHDTSALKRRGARAATFVACLELGRRQAVKLEQERPMAKVWIHPADRSAML